MLAQGAIGDLFASLGSSSRNAELFERHEGLEEMALLARECHVAPEEFMKIASGLFASPSGHDPVSPRELELTCFEALQTCGLGEVPGLLE